MAGPCEAPLLRNVELFRESLTSCHDSSDSYVSYWQRLGQFVPDSVALLVQRHREHTQLTSNFLQQNKTKWIVDLLNWLGMHFSFLWPQWQHAVLQWSSSRLSALDNNGTHYFPVVGIIKVALFPIYVDWNSFSALDTCPSCHFLSSPRGWSCGWSYCSTLQQGWQLLWVSDAGPLKLGVTACKELWVQMWLVTTFREFRQFHFLGSRWQCHTEKKGTEFIDRLPS